MTYKEIFKFIAGAFAWDGIIALWFLFSGFYPIKFFGITFSQTGLIIVFFIDGIIAVVLSYLAWRKNSKTTKKNKRKKR